VAEPGRYRRKTQVIEAMLYDGSNAKAVAKKPSVGRIVHYVSYGTPNGEYASECRAAIVTEVTGQLEPDGQWRVGLFVANPTGLFLNRVVVYHEGGPYVAGVEREYPGGTWHWPERV
jgi:hypothetical protein